MVTKDTVGAEKTELTRRFGAKAGVPMAKIGLRTEADLLHHYPFRYVERGALTSLADGFPGEDVTYIARVRSTTAHTARSGMRYVKVVIEDGTSAMTLTFFAPKPHLVKHLEHQLKPGTVAMFAGTIKAGWDGTGIELTHPEYEPLEHEAADDAAARLARPVPIYRATAKLKTWNLRKYVRMLVDPLRPADVPEPIPAEIRESRRLMSSYAALRAIHDPESMAEAERARHTLRYQEAFLLQTALARRRADMDAHPATPRPSVAGGLVDALDAHLPFALTAGQREVAAELSADLSRPVPMQRLLQGEVGSGKTVVALRAMLQVVDGGGQAALLAPTEVLAQQHARTIEALLGPLAEGGMLGGADGATRVALLTGSLGATARKKALLDAASGAAGIVVGTHALLSETVQFADLGLVVVDEQHRFGVEQRDALRERTPVPHQLVMTATPIPRSVAMTFFGDVDTSTLREIPAGRSPITTHVVPGNRANWMERTWRFAADQAAQGGRVYVVAPRIGENLADDAEAAQFAQGQEPDETLTPLAVLEVAEELRREPALAGLEIGVMHGRLPSEEKDAVMAAFAAGRVQVLVSTTVIEVGVDVPDATVMVILDADRFGLSQLHQLRGRVGRGAKPGTCFVVTRGAEVSPAMDRLQTFAGTLDGFVLAEADLAARREGDVLGAQQSGRGSSLKLVRVLHDRTLIEHAREDARALVAADPDLTAHRALARAVADLIDPDHEEFLDRA